jgi:NADH-ubiquinone oxidoreductase chain 5
MYLTIIILPLLGSIASGLFGRKIGVTGSHLIACSCVVLTTIFCIIAFFEVNINNTLVNIELFR